MNAHMSLHSVVSVVGKTEHKLGNTTGWTDFKFKMEDGSEICVTAHFANEVEYDFRNVKLAPIDVVILP